jgi:DNA-binding NtrC family response regulator
MSEGNVKANVHTVPARRVLVALASHEESASLRQILDGDGWDLCFVSTFPDAAATLRTNSHGVVICPGRFEDGHGWRDVLNEIHRIPIPPQLIVADRLADEALWAEVLNLGCYDLLITPFEAEDVLRVLPMAWSFWECSTPRSKRLKPEEREYSRGFLATGAD